MPKGTNATRLKMMMRMSLTGIRIRLQPCVSHVSSPNAAALWLYRKAQMGYQAATASRSCRIWCRHSPSMGQPFRRGRWGAVSKRIS